MILTSLGKIAVATPGTPVPLSVSPTTRVARLTIQAAPTNTGKIYFGATGLVKSTLAGVARILSATDATYEVVIGNTFDGITLSQLAIDADNAGEGAVVSYWIE